MTDFTIQQESEDDKPKYGLVLDDPFDPRKQPAEDTPETPRVEHPKTLNVTRATGRIRFFAGVGDREKARVMFVGPTVLEDEAATGLMSKGRTFNRDYGLLQGDHGKIMRKVFADAELPLENEYYTTLCKWLLPKELRSTLHKDIIAYGWDCFVNEVKDVKPKIIVAMGKAVFDAIMGRKFQMKAVDGGWFTAEIGGEKVWIYPTCEPSKPVRDPSMVFKLEATAHAVVDMLDTLNKQGTEPDSVAVADYRTIDTKAQLSVLVDDILQNYPKESISLDNEWSGANHKLGKLRSHQICWAPGKAAYIRFRSPAVKGVKADRDGMYHSFDGTLSEAGEILGRLYNRPTCKVMGHQIAADLPWLHEYMGIDLYGKCDWDTLYAEQCINEYADGKLEIMGARYIRGFHRWDIDLLLHKMDNKVGKMDGYGGHIPDSILIPYGCKDTDAPKQIRPKQELLMLRQGIKLYQYYRNEFLPFVSDGFTNFTVKGLPVSMEIMNELREFYLWAKDAAAKRLSKEVVSEASLHFAKFMGENSKLTEHEIEMVLELSDPHTDENGKPVRSPAEKDRAIGMLVPQLSNEAKLEFIPVWEHWQKSPSFNCKSGDDMRRWLFEIKKLLPLRSTGNKDKGKPSVSWDKVLAMPPDKQKEFKPSYDKNTLAAYEGTDPLIERLLQFILISTVTRSFLRPGEMVKVTAIDAETGEETEEEEWEEDGLHAWVSDDVRIHTQLSATETGRPRSWNPNSLNWPSYVNERMEKGLMSLCKYAQDEGFLPEAYTKYVTEKPLSLRGFVHARPDWCMVESDYKTAELRALAFISGDAAMMAVICDPDKSWAYAKRPGDKDAVEVRLSYAADSGIAPENQNPAFLRARVSKRMPVEDLIKDLPTPHGKSKKEFAWETARARASDPKFPVVIVDEKKGMAVVCEKISVFELVRDDKGNLVHPGHDMHWELIEYVRKKPREMMQKKPDRDSGKVGNFASCLSSDTCILTKEEGRLYITEVTAAHTLWDGVEWVKCDGVIYQGMRRTITYQGLRATADHEVWVRDGRKMPLGEVASLRLDLVLSEDDCGYNRPICFPDTEHGRRNYEVQVSDVEEPVYDILNAGPRRRFTANGFLVSNCYGASGASLERKIYADTGVKPEEGTGQGMLDALNAKYPVAQQFLRDQELKVFEGKDQAFSGRIRHFPLHSAAFGVSRRNREFVASAWGRESRNFPFQSSVASVATRAYIKLMRHFREHKMQAEVIALLYDSIVTHCPLEERMEVARLHQLYMCDDTPEFYGPRKLTYPIDTEFNVGWSHRPDKKTQALYDDPKWRTPNVS